MRAIHIAAFGSLIALYLAACNYAGAGLPWVSTLRLAAEAQAAASSIVNQVVMQLTPS